MAKIGKDELGSRELTWLPLKSKNLLFYMLFFAKTVTKFCSLKIIFKNF